MAAESRPDLVEMNWDPITRIVGSLGIYTKIDFANREVAECYSTSSIFRGYSVFMKGKDPRDAHFIQRRGTLAFAMSMGPPVPTKTRCRTRPFLRRTVRRSLRVSTSCARCEALIPVCLAASICIWARAKS